MNDLDMCVAMARLEGVQVVKESGAIWTIGKCERYNPITDLALNCALRDKYKVEIDYYYRSLSVHNGFEVGDNESTTSFESIKEIHHAVIECILKANWLYK